MHNLYNGAPIRIDDMSEVRAIFLGKVDFTMNWLFCGTSGVHGTYRTLDEALCLLNGNVDEKEADDYRGDHPLETWPPATVDVTILIVQPRLVRMYYGHIPVSKRDARYLQALVQLTLDGIAESQERNR